MEGDKTTRFYPRISGLHGDKIRKISNTLQKLTIEGVNEKGPIHIESVETRLNLLEKKLREFKEMDAKRWEALTNSIEFCLSQVENDKKDQQRMIEDYTYHLNCLLDKFKSRLCDYTKQIQQVEQEMINEELGSFYKEFVDNLQQEKQNIKEQITGITEGNEFQLNKAKEMIEQMKEDWLCETHNLEEKLEFEVTNYNEKLIRLKNERVELEQNLMEVLKNFVQKCVDEIQELKKNRIGQEETVLNILDKATIKLNHLCNL